VPELRALIQQTDKYLFAEFRDEEITLNQLRARLAEKYEGVKYKVLDDLKGILMPQILEGIDEEYFQKLFEGRNPKERIKSLLRPLEDWEVNDHCIRSIIHKFDVKEEAKRRQRLMREEKAVYKLRVQRHREREAEETEKREAMKAEYEA